MNRINPPAWCTQPTECLHKQCKWVKYINYQCESIICLILLNNHKIINYFLNFRDSTANRMEKWIMLVQSVAVTEWIREMFTFRSQSFALVRVVVSRPLRRHVFHGTLVSILLLLCVHAYIDIFNLTLEFEGLIRSRWLQCPCGRALL